jgi:hypothetical protein
MISWRMQLRGIPTAIILPFPHGFHTAKAGCPQRLRINRVRIGLGLRDVSWVAFSLHGGRAP